MPLILQSTLPFATDEYDRDTMQLILTILQTSLDDVVLPVVVSGEDDVFGTSWFLS
tara:strand:- start:1309 stop:1476 length:168 start_codon:yes stop_codon:yes gene_type:complete